MSLLFVHGAGGSSLSFYYQTRVFPEADALDLPGHPAGKQASSVEEYTEWVRGYIAGKAYKDIVLAGHSMGGAIALTYALRYPEELRAVILMSTGARLRVLPEILNRGQDGIREPGLWFEQRSLAYEKVEPVLRQRLLERAWEVGPAVALHDLLCCDKFDVMEQVEQIHLPTLIIFGMEDVQTPPKYHNYLHKHIKGSQKMAIRGGTHQAHLEYPEQVNVAIRDFLVNLDQLPGHIEPARVARKLS